MKCITTFESGGCDLTVWEDNGKFTIEIMPEQEENTFTIALNKIDILDMVSGFAGTSNNLAKEMMTEIIEQIK